MNWPNWSASKRMPSARPAPFRKFRAMQTDHGMDAADFTDAKLTLRQRLDALRAELDRYLAKEYGVKRGR